MKNLNIYEFLKSLQGQKIKYVPNGGNAGDDLIAYATLQIFRELKLDFEMCVPWDQFNGDLLIYGGGGSLIHNYTFSREFLERNYKHNKIIVLPHTVNCHHDVLNKLPANTTIITREETSYNYVKKHMNHPENVFISDDMAFHTKGVELYKEEKGIGECNAFRLDSERTNIKVPENNKDVSTDFMCCVKWMSPEQRIDVSSDNLFSYLCKFNEINTNRLHISIAGALLGKKVNFYPNSYYKNKAVFDFSMKKEFSNVNFIDIRN